MSAMERMAVALAPGVEVESSTVDVLKYFAPLATGLGRSVYHRCARVRMDIDLWLEDAYCILMQSPSISRVATFVLVAHL
jgi:hypothetical protein